MLYMRKKYPFGKLHKSDTCFIWKNIMLIMVKLHKSYIMLYMRKILYLYGENYINLRYVLFEKIQCVKI